MTFFVWFASIVAALILGAMARDWWVGTSDQVDALCTESEDGHLFEVAEAADVYRGGAR